MSDYLPDPDYLAAALRGAAAAKRMIEAATAEAERLGLDLRECDIAALLDVAHTARLEALGLSWPPRG